MKIVSTALFIAIALLFTGCGEHKEHAHDNAAFSSADSTYGLQLNGSQKWPMDKHTRIMFQKMSSRLESIDTREASPEELKNTATLLRQDLDSLIAGCTMQGAAHDQLHVYLTAYIPALKAMSDSGNQESAAKVQELIRLYPRYFE